MISRINGKRATLAAAAFVALYASTTAYAHPRGHAPTEHAQALQHAEDKANAAKLKKLHETLEKKPDEFEGTVAYARKVATQARRLGDTALLRGAEETLLPWEMDPDAPTEILILRANIKQIDHRFDEALEDLDRVLVREPSNPQALLSRAFIHATIGTATHGKNDCAALRSNVSVTIRETCSARILSLTGDLEKAHARMEAVIAVIRANNLQERMFALSVAAEIAERIGETETARAQYAKLISADREAVFARAAYADFLLAQGEHDEAANVIGPTPNTEALLLLSALAGKHEEAGVAMQSASEMSARMAADRVNEDFSHAREYARFALDYLEDATLALEYAQENWRVQKEPIDARILARSAIANGRHDVLTEVRRWSEMTNMEDRRLQILFSKHLHDESSAKTGLETLTRL